MNQGLGFRVWDLGCRVWGLGFRVWCLGIRAWELGLRVEELRVRVERLELETESAAELQRDSVNLRRRAQSVNGHPLAKRQPPPSKVNSRRQKSHRSPRGSKVASILNKLSLSNSREFEKVSAAASNSCGKIKHPC